MVKSIVHWSSQQDARIKTVYVDKIFQTADLYLMNILKKGDILVIRDYDLAAVARSRGDFVLSPRGNEYTNNESTVC